MVTLVLGGKGGVGKTAVAVSLAVRSALAEGPTLLADLDPQDTGGATWWLDRCDPLASLWWARVTAAELVTAMASAELAGRAIIIDTPPRLDDVALRAVVPLADAVIVPGSVVEYASILATARTAQAVGSAPVGAVMTRTAPPTLTSSLGLDVAERLAAAGIAVLGAMRSNHGLGVAALYGDRPDQIADQRQRQRWADDIEGIAQALDQMTRGS